MIVAINKQKPPGMTAVTLSTETASAASSGGDLWDALEELDPVTANTALWDPLKVLQHYLDHKRIPRSSNPLEFWEKHKDLFPYIYPIAQKYLLMPATSVASERAASRLKNLVGDKKASIGDVYLSKRMFLNTCPADLIVLASYNEASEP